MQVIRVRDRKLVPTLKRVIGSGEIAAIPTDTVYGLIGKAEREVMERIARLKAKVDYRFAILLPSKGAVQRFTRIKSKTEKRAVEGLLPGKVTLLLRSKKEFDFAFSGRIGVRVPKLDWLLEFLKDLDYPIIATSANRHEELPLRNWSEIRSVFPEIDLIVDGDGISGRPSTVIDLTTYPPVIKRLGVESIFTIDKVLKRKVRIDPDVYFSILIVCTGNSCRSPMAVGILRRLLRGYPVFVYSAGTAADLGLPATENAL
ncbi:MAG TPA: hypothetical protein EYP24_04910, partial [bacterium (Candidatus Stahlbacteria)]|nr:hypothetical protein [Candidatus Stahlbacteria bacterium]